MEIEIIRPLFEFLELVDLLKQIKHYLQLIKKQVFQQKFAHSYRNVNAYINRLILKEQEALTIKCVIRYFGHIFLDNEKTYIYQSLMDDIIKRLKKSPLLLKEQIWYNKTIEHYASVQIKTKYQKSYTNFKRRDLKISVVLYNKTLIEKPPEIFLKYQHFLRIYPSLKKSSYLLPQYILQCLPVYVKNYSYLMNTEILLLTKTTKNLLLKNFFPERNLDIRFWGEYLPLPNK